MPTLRAIATNRYWLEKSKSVVAPIVGHNVSDVVEYAILFVWVAVG